MDTAIHTFIPGCNFFFLPFFFVLVVRTFQLLPLAAHSSPLPLIQHRAIVAPCSNSYTRKAPTAVSPNRIHPFHSRSLYCTFRLGRCCVIGGESIVADVVIGGESVVAGVVITKV